MRCLNKSGNRHTYNRHSLESIEETRGNTATIPLTTLSTDNSANRRPTAPTLTKPRLYAYVPSIRINLGLPNGGYTTHDLSWLHFLVLHCLHILQILRDSVFMKAIISNRTRIDFALRLWQVSHIVRMQKVPDIFIANKWLLVLDTTALNTQDFNILLLLFKVK